MDVFDLISRGGPLMWPIMLSSLVAATFFFERLYALRRSGIVPRDTLLALRNHLRAGDVTRAEHLCREKGSVIASVALTGLEHRAGGRALAKEAMEEVGGVAVGRLDRGVGVLSTIAAIAPLLGLLGTVTGMIKVFRDVSETSTPDIAVLAHGIWEALITTGAGLTVAIPTYIAFRVIDARIGRLGGELEAASLGLLDLIPTTGARPLPTDGGIATDRSGAPAAGENA